MKIDKPMLSKADVEYIQQSGTSLTPKAAEMAINTIIAAQARISELEAQLHQATHCAVCDTLVQHPDGALHCKECVS